MQSQADKEFQRNCLNFKETLKSKTTWEEFEKYVGHKLEKGGRLKAFILTYLNRDFEQPYDDGQQYYCTQKVYTWRDKNGYQVACHMSERKAVESYNKSIRQRGVEYRKKNKEQIIQRRAEYYRDNKEKFLKHQALLCKNIREARRFYCETCDVVCNSNYALGKHFETKGHTLKEHQIEYDIFNNAPSLPSSRNLIQVARNRGISWKTMKRHKKEGLAQLLNIPLIMNPNF